MGNSDTSTPKKNYSASAVCVVIGLACLVVFYNVWYNVAYNVDSKTKKEVQNQEGMRITNLTSTVTVTNYFPLRTSTISPKIFKITRTPEGNRARNEIDNNNESLTEEKITIHSFTWEAKYGDEEVRPQYKENNLIVFPGVITSGMTNTTVILNWSYAVPEYKSGANQSHISLDFEVIENEVDFLGYDLRFLTFEFSDPGPIGDVASLFWYGFSYLFFVVSGVVFSCVVFKFFVKDIKIVEAFDHLTKFDSQVKKGETIEVNKEIEGNLKKIIDFPNQICSLGRLVFGLSILILKIIVNIICKKHNERIDSYGKIYPYKKKRLKKIFSKYSKQSFEKLWDFLPEFRTITVFIGILTAVGISFSFNVGAAAPFVYSVVLFYFFFNIGSTFYFVQKSKINIIWPILILLAGILVVSAPTIIEMLRIVS